MNELVTFEFEGHGVRSVLRNGAPWWVAADVAVVLGIGRTDDAVRRLDEDEKGTDIIRTLGGDQTMVVINESGLYSLILTSRKAAAKRFKKWVTGEVLPAIRRTGSFGAPAIDTLVERMASLEARLTAIGTDHWARAEEYRPVRVFQDGITVAELVDGLNLPAGISRRSVSQQLTYRLTVYAALKGLPSIKRRKVWQFARIASSELAQQWRAEMIASAKRDKRQTELKLVPRDAAS